MFTPIFLGIHHWLGLSNQSRGICYVEGVVDRRLKSQVSKLLLIIDSTLGTPSSKLVYLYKGAPIDMQEMPAGSTNK